MARSVASAEDPLERHRKSVQKIEGLLADVVSQLPRGVGAEFRGRVELVRRYVICREDAKHYLMLGYDLLRDLALEAGRRLEIGDGVFYLTRDELFQSLQTGLAPLGLIRQRRQTYRDEERVSLPTVLDAEELANPGAAAPRPAGDQDLRGLAISPGQASGTARIVRLPTDEGGFLRGEVLVCTSTDPSWTPLFARAVALVLETGGVLSHGAIVAREMGIPAVVVPGATKLIDAGELLTVDGTHGLVHRGEGHNAGRTLPSDESDTFVPFDERPPGPGRKDRIAAKWRNWLGLGWSLLLVAFYVLPDVWFRQPILSAIDRLAWPGIRVLGKPGTVLLVALVLALSVVLIEVLITDHRRLAVVKRRAKAIDNESAKLRPGSPRRTALKRLAASAQYQAVSAAMVPVGFLLGPMILSIVWLGERMDPVKSNPPPGASVSIVAKVDSNYRHPIRLEVPARFEIDPATPAAQTLPLLRETLTKLLEELRRPSAERTANAALDGILQTSQQDAADNLQAYLDQGIPPQGLTWSIHSPAEAQGVFSAIASSGGERLCIRFTLGDRDAPQPARIDSGPTNQIKSLEIFFGGAKSKAIFCRPFAWLSDSDAPALRWLSRTQVGWLSVYLFVYFTTLFACRWILA
jgi:pyruvate,water dikinase